MKNSVNDDEIILNAHWHGPFTPKTLPPGDWNVLYAIYGTHVVYGSNTLLYIGQTIRGADVRLPGHSWWIDYESAEVKIHVASVGVLESWEDGGWRSGDLEKHHERPDEAIIAAAEGLLIMGHTPAYNTKGINGCPPAKGYRIFNTGRYDRLLPEVSYRRWDDDWAKAPEVHG